MRYSNKYSKNEYKDNQDRRNTNKLNTPLNSPKKFMTQQQTLSSKISS